MSYLAKINHAAAYYQKFQEAKTEKEKIDILVATVLDLRQEEPETSLILTDEIIDRSEKINYIDGIGEGLNHKGACYWILGEYEDGLDELTQAYEIATERKNEKLEAKILNNFGRIYRELGDIANALKNFEASMALNEKLGNEINLSINLINISTLYYDLGDYDTALEYAEKNLHIYERQHDLHKLVNIYNVLGNILFKLERFDKAELYFEKILEIAKGNTLYRATGKIGLGKVYFLKGNIPAAEEYLEMGLKMATASNSFENEIMANFYIAKLLLKKHKPESALEYALNGYHLAQEYQRKHDLHSYHEVLSQIYDSLGKIDLAYQHLKEFEKLKEQIFQQATLNKLRNLQIKSQILFAKKEKEVAEKTAELKQQFMANMSHEIRTPMNAIVGLVNLLLQKEPKAEQEKYLKAIQKSADNLLVIINDILDLSKIEAGKIVLEHISFELGSTIEAIYNTLFLKAEEKNLQFITQIHAQQPIWLKGDPTRLTQILINLLGNAIKFTEKGKVELAVYTQAIEAGKQQIIFDVKDTGIGISKEYVASIFESFTQAGTDTARKFGGTGLGLTISKQLVTLMQGDIKVESTLGVGTTFTVAIPFEISNAQEGARENEEDIHLEDLKGLNILLVEDNEFNVMVAEETLKSSLPDVKLFTASNGAEAISVLETNGKAIDLVLMDIQMPVMNGMEATQKIRASSSDFAQVKIIALTANAFEGDIKKYFRMGMNGYITKPFKIADMMKEIYNVLHHKPHESKQKEDAAIKTSTKEEVFVLQPPITDMSFLNSFAGGKQEKIQKYKQMFLTNAPRLFEDIQKSLNLKDYEGVKIAAHSLKPQLGYMGVKEEVSNVFLLEKSAGEQAHYHVIEKLVQRLDLVLKQCFKELSE